jgi:hypothetical protein
MQGSARRRIFKALNFIKSSIFSSLPWQVSRHFGCTGVPGLHMDLPLFLLGAKAASSVGGALTLLSVAIARSVTVETDGLGKTIVKF